MGTYPRMTGTTIRLGSSSTVTPKLTKKRSAKKSVNKPKGSTVIKQMIRKIVNWSMRDHDSEMHTIEEIRSSTLSANGIKLELHRASGGLVVEIRRIDRKTDETHYELHIISDSENIGEKLSHIITLEALRR